mmetsp:Transcript_38531/g.108933  ORF Transcript_38531/g.108933 Transcript_38531/m.108933 type:complete len:340 (-) Transcript_38531:113-1132(-)|eukprot:CAMPEP_0117677520 /NCGR_PEP_ID=MMETSP0804-20121206/16789_1 /TAXON_ID=1074897 /ORGANISM="Tetraselmis astigmatica, Strain CCMP880" /LENGTH=339 /DNA_ID=CAMNT_0005486809 /DNA_START=197 /DNA_END=1216 /DNA_ORIENTATION=+
MPRFATTTPRDRTADFTALVERLKKQPGVTTSSDSNANGTIQNRANGGATVQQQSEFARKAALIGRSIHDTSTKLQKLAQLAKRTSMFDDPAVEIDKLTSIIKHDIQGLNAAIADLQKVAASNRECSKQSSFHSTTVVDNLRSRLKDATKEFKDVLTMRTDNLKVHQNRRQMYSASQTGSASNLPAAPLGLGGQGLMLPQASRPKSAHELFGGAPKGSLQGGAGENTPLLSNGGLQQQQLQLAAPQDSYMSTRAEALRNVESTIVELGGIFQQLAHMVQQQGEMAVRIDENVEDTLQNVEGAQAHLLKYLNTISSNRWLIMKIFAVLMVFLVFFVVFIV